MVRRLSVLTALTLGSLLVCAVALGARNPQIAGLQVALRAYSLYDGRIDAIAGPRTVAATRAFQGRVGLPQTGRADVRTRKALGAVGGPLFGQRALRPGMFGWDVAVLQFLLAERGLSRGPIDGWFDGLTAAGVRRFQRNAALESDGVLGTVSLSALARRAGVPLAHPPPRRFVRYRVRAGDSLIAIAAGAHTTAPELARVNGMRLSDLLLIGRLLRVPMPAAPASVPQEAPPTAIRGLIDHWARRSGVDLHLVRALAWVESGYQPQVVSAAGALGVMQVMPTTWAWVEEVVLRRKVPKTAAGNVLVGVTYLRQLLSEFKGDRRLAVAAWLQGPRSVRDEGVHRATEPFVNAVLSLSRRV